MSVVFLRIFPGRVLYDCQDVVVLQQKYSSPSSGSLVFENLKPLSRETVVNLIILSAEYPVNTWCQHYYSDSVAEQRGWGGVSAAI